MIHLFMGAFHMKGLRGRHVILACGLSIIVFLSGAKGTADGSPHDFQLWSPVYLTYNYSDKIQGWYEVQPRFGDNVSQVNQLLLRTALGYRVTKFWSLWQGYAWTPSFVPRFISENRIYQQLLYLREFPTFKVMSRTRFEQRWIQNVPGTALRFRELLRGRFPLDHERIWGIIVQDEIFFNFNSPTNGPDAGLDQNRFFLGLNKRINQHVHVDGGYQLQTINTDEPGFIDDYNHILLMQVFLNW